ncbi:prenyltransferase [Arthrobacter sp.]|uniref:prenyltransferase n=1 Tax=Arthrobacter sp. TaxID=1667 RepID=UPI003A91D7DB
MIDLLLTSRPVSWVNTAYPFAAAYLISTGGLSWILAVGTLFFLIPYNLAMYGINDVFDYESDLRNPRKGGAEGAVVDRSRHRAILWASAVTTVPFAIVLATQGPVSANLVLLLSLAAVLAYSAPRLRFKERPFLDSMTSSTHFVSPTVYGLLLGGAEFTGGLWCLVAAYFLWGMASHAFGAVQDIVPDREAGLGSVATVLGARATVAAAGVAYVAAGLLMLGTTWPGPLAGLLALPYLANVLPFLRVDDAGSGVANRGWRRFLWLNYATGFLVTLLLIWYVVTR